MYLILCLTLTIYSTLMKMNRCFFSSCYSFFFLASVLSFYDNDDDGDDDDGDYNDE